MWRNKGPKIFEWRSSEVSPSLNVYSKYELSSSMSGTCAYQIEQLCAHTSDWSDYLNEFEWSMPRVWVENIAVSGGIIDSDAHPSACN